MMNVEVWKGQDGTREWLASQGFRIAESVFCRDRGCNWYAYRRTALESRECECNDGKPMQIVINAFSMLYDGVTHESVEVEVTGEAGGRWYQLKSYGITPDELKEQLSEIETSLILAWNAIK